jgi:epoxyqueuosine reductase
MDAMGVTRRLKEHAAELGFSLAGVCPAVSPPGAARLDQWIAAGYAGQMQYFADRQDAYHDPGRVLEGAAASSCWP